MLRDQACSRHAADNLVPTYAIPVVNNTYDVNLRFSETYWSAPGQRIFDVTIEGQLLIDDLDILTQAAPNTAFDQVFSGISVTDGELNIEFTTLVDNAKISAIEVVGSPSPAPAAERPSHLVFAEIGSGTQMQILNADSSDELQVSAREDASWQPPALPRRSAIEPFRDRVHWHTTVIASDSDALTDEIWRALLDLDIESVLD